MPIKDIHPTHKHIETSDASSFDLVCRDCGAHDELGSWGKLKEPCKNVN